MNLIELSNLGSWGLFEAMRLGGSASIVTIFTALYPLPVVLLAPQSLPGTTAPKRHRCVMETRLLQAQSENMAPIDLISMLVSDELACRSKRLLERRNKQAQFRDRNKLLDNFDFQFNTKMNRSLVFDLATAHWVEKRAKSSWSS